MESAVTVNPRIGIWNGNFNFGPRTTTDYVNKDITFPQNGLAQFSIDVPTGTTSITFTVSLCVPNKYMCILDTDRQGLSFVTTIIAYNTPSQTQVVLIGDRLIFKLSS